MAATEIAMLATKTPAGTTLQVLGERQQRQLRDQQHAGRRSASDVMMHHLDQHLARTLGIVAPLARRRPNSRMRCVTLCHTTPVRPSADHQQQECRRSCRRPPAGSVYWRSLSLRMVSSGCTSNDQSSGDRHRPLDQRLLERGRRAGSQPHEQALGQRRLRVRVVEPHPVEQVVARRSTSSPFCRNSSTTPMTRLTSGLSFGSRRRIVRVAFLLDDLADRVGVAEDLPRQPPVEHDRRPRRGIVFAREPAAGDERDAAAASR